MAEAFDLPKGELMRASAASSWASPTTSRSPGHRLALAAQGAELALGYMEMNEKRVKPLGESIGAKAYVPFDASQAGSIPARSRRLARRSTAARLHRARDRLRRAQPDCWLVRRQRRARGVPEGYGRLGL